MSKKNSYIIFGVMILAALVMTVIGYRMGREFGYRVGMEAGQGSVSEHGQTRPGQEQEDQLQPGQEQDGQSRVGGPQVSEAQELLFNLNRSSIENIDVEGGTVYVIGHQSPDSDTVCSAIAYARMLTMLGVNAEAAVTDKLNNETAYILREAGVKAPPVLEDASGKDIFLVDHSEYAQAAEGMEDAHIVGILDHHGVGSVTTGYQIVYEARPIGATATIVWLDYLNYGLEVDKTTAFVLLGAVLSDTDNLTGSTVTYADKQAVSTLADIAGVEDVDGLARKLHEMSLSYEGMTDEDILFSDYKEYEVSGVKFGIGSVGAIDEKTAEELAGRMKTAMQDGFKTRDVSLMYALVGIRENGEKIDYVVPYDEMSRQVLEEAFPQHEMYGETAFVFPKGLGRKTKFVPGLTEYLAAHPKE